MTQDKITLWKRDGFHEDRFIRAATLDEVSNNYVILPIAYWLEQYAQNSDTAQRLKGTGVFVAGADDIDPIIPFFEEIAVIALDFITFSDGRSYSKAASLKNHGFKGEIRAVGNILIDQISNLLRAGFDSLEVSHPLTKERLQKGVTINYPGFYQPSAGVTPLPNAKRLWRNM